VLAFLVAVITEYWEVISRVIQIASVLVMAFDFPIFVFYS